MENVNVYCIATCISGMIATVCFAFLGIQPILHNYNISNYGAQPFFIIISYLTGFGLSFHGYNCITFAVRFA